MLFFFSEMLRRIANVDETELSLNGSETQVGGRPAISYWDPHLPMIMRSVAKSSLKCTCIFGSTAVGECIPVHHQLPTSATIAERQKFWNDFCHNLKKTRGRFGHDEVREWPCGALWDWNE